MASDTGASFMPSDEHEELPSDDGSCQIEENSGSEQGLSQGDAYELVSEGDDADSSDIECQEVGEANF